MKKIVIILIVLMCFNLYASNDDINLSPIMIYGERKIKLDSLNLNKFIEDDVRIDSLSKLDYKHKIIKNKFNFPQKELLEKNFYAMAGIGYDKMAECKILYKNSNHEFLNLAPYFYWEDSDKLDKTLFYAFWNFKSAHQKISLLPFYSDYSYVINQQSKDYLLQSFRLNYSMRNISTKLFDLSEIEVLYGNNSIEFEDIIKENAVTVKIGANHEVTQLFANTKLQYLKDRFTFNFELGKYNFYDIDKIGLWTSLNKNIVPSVSFLKRFSFLNSVFFLENKPLLSSRSYFDHMDENELQYPDKIDDKQQTSPVNLKFGLENNHLINFRVYYNLILTKNYHFYQANFANLYQILNKDAMIHKGVAELNYKSGNLAVNNEFIIRNTSLDDYKIDEVPYLAKIENNLGINYKWQKFLLGANGCLLLDRLDSDGFYQEDVFLLDLSLHWKYTPELNLVIEADNILNQDYREFDQLPLEETRIFISVETMF